MRWKNLEPVRVSVSQKEENTYRIFKLMNLLARQEETHRHREQTCGHKKGMRVGQIESSADLHSLPCVR